MLFKPILLISVDIIAIMECNYMGGGGGEKGAVSMTFLKSF